MDASENSGKAIVPRFTQGENVESVKETSDKGKHGLPFA